MSTAPFGPQRRMLSSHSPLPLHGANARGVETVTRMSTSSVNNVNSVLLCRSFSPSHSLFPVPVNVAVSSAHVLLARSRPQGLPAHNPLSSTCLVASTFQQDLVLPFRVTPIDAQKPWCELCFHPDQVKVDYVITGLTSGFHPGFDPLVVSLKSTVHNMPSAPLPPLVIDQYLIIWHMINYRRHPGKTTILAGLTNCSIFTFLGDENFSSNGRDLVFYSPPYGHFYLISQYHQTQLERLW